MQAQHLSTVGLIGTGTMGTGMGHNLLKKAFPLIVYARRKDGAISLQESGAKRIDSVQELAAHASVVLLSLSDGFAVQEIVEQLCSSPHTHLNTIIDTSTIEPERTKNLAEKLAKNNITLLDCPVSGGDVGAREGTLTIMAAGREERVDEIRPVLEAIGRNIFYCGESGSGQLTKAANQIAVALSVASMTEALLFAEKSGLNVERTIEILRSGAAGSWSFQNYAPRLLKGDLSPGFAANYMLKDLKIALESAQDNLCQLPATELVTQLFQDMANKGFGNLGNHALKRRY